MIAHVPVEDRVAAAKWITGLCGIGFTLAMTSVISSIAVFEGNPDDCYVQVAVADAVGASRQLAFLFGLGGLCALFAVGFSTRHRRSQRGDESGAGKTARMKQAPSGLLAGFQLLGLAIGGLLFCVAIVMTLTVTGDVAGSGLRRFGNDYHKQCEAKLGPAHH